MTDNMGQKINQSSCAPETMKTRELEVSRGRLELYVHFIYMKADFGIPSPLEIPNPFGFQPALLSFPTA